MFLILFISLFSIFIPNAYASDEFKISQDTTYSVDLSGKAYVKQNVSLTNNYSQIYAKEYQVDLSGSNIQNIKGNDINGNIVDKILQQNDVTNIFLKFSKPSIGKDQTHKFFIHYDIVDFAKKKGNTWEIQFPSYADKSTHEQHTITVEIPVSFGQLSYSSIPINQTHTLGNFTQIQINQTQLKDKKILLVFGNLQLFDFTLNYFLENKNDNDIVTEIAIPPDMDNQTIILKSIDPLPREIKLDDDGNWLAQYEIKSKQFIDVIVIGQAKIHPPLPVYFTSPTAKLTQTQKYWPTSDPTIIDTAKNLNSPKQIHQFVVNKLTYNYVGINSAYRKGALAALQQPELSLCTEFTDLFVTLARSKSIPAREIEGFAYSNDPRIKPINSNSDVLHAWPQYFDQQTSKWIQIDPTWEKTTFGIDYFSDLDLNHITFVIHGAQSDYPPPPGSFKKDKNSKSVFVDFATEELPSNYIPPSLTVDGNSIKIKNTNFFSIHQLQIKSETQSWQETIELLPPLGTAIVSIPKANFIKSLMPQSQHYIFTVNAKESTISANYRLTNKQHFLNLSITIGSCIFLLSLGGIILTASSKSNEKKH